MENESTNNADYEGGSSYDEYCEGGGSFRRAGVAAMLAGVLIFDTIIGVSMYRDHHQDKEIQQARIEWDKEDNDRNCNLDDIAKLADESLFGLEQLQKDDPKEKTYKKITVGMGIGDYIDSYDHMLNNTETIGSIIEGYGWKFDTDSFEDTWSKKYPMYSFLGYMNNMPADLLNIVSAEDKDKIAIEISELATKYDTESADLEKILDKAVVGSIVDKVGDCDVDIDKMADALHGMATLNSSTFINRLSIERDFDIYIKHIESMAYGAETIEEGQEKIVKYGFDYHLEDEDSQTMSQLREMMDRAHPSLGTRVFNHYKSKATDIILDHMGYEYGYGLNIPKLTVQSYLLDRWISKTGVVSNIRELIDHIRQDKTITEEDRDAQTPRSLQLNSTDMLRLFPRLDVLSTNVGVTQRVSLFFNAKDQRIQARIRVVEGGAEELAEMDNSGTSVFLDAVNTILEGSGVAPVDLTIYREMEDKLDILWGEAIISVSVPGWRGWDVLGELQKAQEQLKTDVADNSTEG